MKKIFWLEDQYKSFRAFNFSVKESYSIVRVESYYDALEKINDCEYDLFIIDMIIPGGGPSLSLEELIKKRDKKLYGLEFVKYLRNNAFVQPIIALTVIREQNFIDSINNIDSSIVIMWKYDSDGEFLLETIKGLIGE